MVRCNGEESNDFFPYLIRREVWISKLCSSQHPQRKFLRPPDHIHGEPRYRPHKRKEDAVSYLVLPKSTVDFDFDGRDVETL